MKVHASAPQISRRALAGMLVAALAVLSAPARSFAQQQPPLAEVARQEAERRKTAKTTQKVITTKDLPESARRGPAPVSPAGSATAPAGGGGEQAAADPKAAGDAAAAPAPRTDGNDEKAWRGRIEQARESVRRNEAFAEALQSRINALTGDFASRDNPVQRAKIGEDRQKALAELERVRNDVQLGKKQIADIEEEARKAGVPPGWLR
jgi:hypothetical protein